MRNRVPGLGFERGLDGEVEGDVGNRSRAIGGGEIGRSGGATAGGGSEAPASSCSHGEDAGEGKERPVRVLTTT
jgi:hypothetical protein